jgi:hypothetical protein
MFAAHYLFLGAGPTPHVQPINCFCGTATENLAHSVASEKFIIDINHC